MGRRILIAVLALGFGRCDSLGVDRFGYEVRFEFGEVRILDDS